jgi:hypothetical protein
MEPQCKHDDDEKISSDQEEEEDEWIDQEAEDDANYAGRSVPRDNKDLELPARVRRTPDKSLKQLAYIVLRSRQSLGAEDGSSYFVITPDFCKTVSCARRRVYDVCNVLEGIGMFARMPGVIRTYKVIGTQGVKQFVERILLDGVKALPSTFNRSTKYVRNDPPPPKRKKKTITGKRRPVAPTFAHQPPPWIDKGSGSGDNGRDRLKNMTRSILYALVMELYADRDEPWSKRDFVDWLAVQHGGAAENMQYQTVHRRAYDVLNVFEVVGLIRLMGEHTKQYRFCGHQQIRDDLLRFPDEYQLKLVEKGSPPNSIRIPGDVDDGAKFAVPQIPAHSLERKATRRSERVQVRDLKKPKISVGPPRISLICHEVWDYPIPPPPPMPIPHEDSYFLEGEDGTDSSSNSSSSSSDIDMSAHFPALIVPFPWEELEIK